MSKPPSNLIDLLTDVRIKSTWTKASELVTDGYGNVRRLPSETGMVIAWAADGVGFGEFTFTFTEDEIKCDSECMGPEFVETVMMWLARSAQYDTEKDTNTDQE